MEGLLSLRGKQKILQKVFSTVDCKSSILKGHTILGITNIFGPELTEHSITAYGMPNMISHMFNIFPKGYLIIVLSSSVSLNAPSLNILSFSVICRQRIKNLKALLRFVFLKPKRGHTWDSFNRFLQGLCLLSSSLVGTSTLTYMSNNRRLEIILCKFSIFFKKILQIMI